MRFKMRFIESDMFCCYSETQGLLEELVFFNGFKLYTRLDFSRSNHFCVKMYELLQVFSNMKFMELNMFHVQIENEDLLKELVFLQHFSAKE